MFFWFYYVLMFFSSSPLNYHFLITAPHHPNLTSFFLPLYISSPHHSPIFFLLLSFLLSSPTLHHSLISSLIICSYAIFVFLRSFFSSLSNYSSLIYSYATSPLQLILLFLHILSVTITSPLTDILSQQNI